MDKEPYPISPEKPYPKSQHNGQEWMAGTHNLMIMMMMIMGLIKFSYCHKYPRYYCVNTKLRLSRLSILKGSFITKCGIARRNL